MQLIWLRHGETEENALRKYVGHLDPPLNGRGWEQVNQLADQLSAYAIDVIYHSDLLRTRQTATAISNMQPKVPPMIETPCLRELYFGTWEGCTYDEISQRDPDHVQKWLHDSFRVAPPRGESLMEMDERLTKWWLQLKENHPIGKTVVVVTHGGPIRWFLAKIVQQDWSRFWEPSVPHGTGWLVRKREKEWKAIPLFGEEREE